MKILVIEDSRMLRLAIAKSVAKEGYDVVAVGDGGEGLKLAQKVQPDAILLDMMLPTLDGTAVLRELKKAAVTASIPVIVLSGLSQKNEERLKMAGATAYFEKSQFNVDPTENSLAEILHRMLSHLRRT
jgi:CheY-like chemotaxis protein